MLEYIIGMGIAFTLVWVTWITIKVVQLHNGMVNHTEVLMAIGAMQIEGQSDESVPMGFHKE